MKSTQLLLFLLPPAFCLLPSAFCLLPLNAERPNILFLIADDASRNSFGAYGAK
jgi:hypothetical protein